MGDSHSMVFSGVISNQSRPIEFSFTTTRIKFSSSTTAMPLAGIGNLYNKGMYFTLLRPETLSHSVTQPSWKKYTILPEGSKWLLCHLPLSESELPELWREKASTSPGAPPLVR